MALIPSAKYPGQVLTSDPTGYPQGKARNDITEGDGTGTPWEEALVNDFWGFHQALLDAADITPSGDPDKVTASDYLDAVEKIAKRAADVDALLNWERALGSTSLGEFDSASGPVDMRGGDFDPISRQWILAGNTDGCVLSFDDGLIFLRADTGMGTSIPLQDVAIGATSSAVAVGGSATVYQRATILSGSWGTIIAPGSPVDLWSVGYDTSNTRYVIIGEKAASAPYAATSDSPTGTAFTDRSSALPASFAGKPLVSLAISDGGVVVAAAVGIHNKLAVSTDGGEIWADSTTTLANGIYQVAYSVEQGLFVAVRTNSTSFNQTYTSADGLVWTLGGSGPTGLSATIGGQHNHGVAWHGEAIVVVGELSSLLAVAFSIDKGVTYKTQVIGWNGFLGTPQALIASRANAKLIATFDNYGSRSLRNAAE